MNVMPQGYSLQNLKKKVVQREKWIQDTKLINTKMEKNTETLLATKFKLNGSSELKNSHHKWINRILRFYLLCFTANLKSWNYEDIVDIFIPMWSCCNLKFIFDITWPNVIAQYESDCTMELIVLKSREKIDM